MQAQPNRYMETAIQTATPAQLLIMLVDGAIRFSRHAIEAIGQNNLQEAHRYLGKVQDIIEEFKITLDRKSPLADNLMSLYEYFLFRLAEANMRKEKEPVEEVLSYLVELKGTWMEAAKLSQAGKAGVKQHG